MRISKIANSQEYLEQFDTNGDVKNLSRAFPILLSAAKDGHPNAQNLIGYSYMKGIGIKRDLKTAVRWFRRAVGKNHREAIFNLALAYDKGIGVKKNLKTAFAL